jgi:hypothetical protein
MRAAVLAALLGAAVAAGAVRADVPDEVIAACQGDAKRLCPGEVAGGDPERSGACMRAHRKAVSAPCRAAVRKHGL